MDQIQAALSIWVPSYDAKHIVVFGCEGVEKTPRAGDRHTGKAYNVRLNVKSCQVTVKNTLTGQVVRVPVTVQWLDETAEQVYSALESRGIVDAIPTLLWTCVVGVVILILSKSNS